MGHRSLSLALLLLAGLFMFVPPYAAKWQRATRRLTGVNAMARKPAKVAKKAAPKRAAKKGMPRKPLPKRKPGEARLLSGGNPQIAKGYGEGPRSGLHRGHAGLEE